MIIAYHTNLDDDIDIQCYMRAIKPALHSHILNIDTVPTTIAKWQEKAALFNTHWCYNKEIKKESLQARPFPHSLPSQSKVDPNAMQVDALLSDQHFTYLCKGHCFMCGQIGNIQCTCLLKDRKTTSPS